MLEKIVKRLTNKIPVPLGTATNHLKNIFSPTVSPKSSYQHKEESTKRQILKMQVQVLEREVGKQYASLGEYFFKRLTKTSQKNLQKKPLLTTQNLAIKKIETLQKKLKTKKDQLRLLSKKHFPPHTTQLSHKSENHT